MNNSSDKSKKRLGVVGAIALAAALTGNIFSESDSKKIHLKTSETSSAIARALMDDSIKDKNTHKKNRNKVKTGESSTAFAERVKSGEETAGDELYKQYNELSNTARRYEVDSFIKKNGFTHDEFSSAINGINLRKILKELDSDDLTKVAEEKHPNPGNSDPLDQYITEATYKISDLLLLQGEGDPFDKTFLAQVGKSKEELQDTIRENIELYKNSKGYLLLKEEELDLLNISRTYELEKNEQ